MSVHDASVVVDSFNRVVEVIAICEMLLGGGGLLDTGGCMNG